MRPLESGFYLKWISQCLATGNSIALLPSVCDCLTFADSHPETRQQSQAGSEWKEKDMMLGRLRRYCMCQFLFQQKKTRRHWGRGMIWWLAFLGSWQKYLFLARRLSYGVLGTEEECSICVLSWIGRLLCSPSVVVEALNISQHWMGELGGFNRPEYAHAHKDAQTHFVFPPPSLTFSLPKPANRREITPQSDLTVYEPSSSTHTNGLNTQAQNMQIFLINWLALARSG